MFEERELLTMILAGAAIIFGVSNRHELRNMPHFQWFAAASISLALSFLVSSVDGVFASRGIEYLEHLLAATGTCLLCVWIYLVHHKGIQES